MSLGSPNSEMSLAIGVAPVFSVGLPGVMSSPLCALSYNCVYGKKIDPEPSVLDDMGSASFYA